MRREGQASFGCGADTDRWRAEFGSPIDIRSTHDLGAVGSIVDWADAQAADGHWVVLLLAYEAAPAFDAALSVRAASAGVPLAWAASYAANTADSPCPPHTEDPLPEIAWAPSIDERQFEAATARVLAHITAGDTYQVNYTFPVRATFGQDAAAWYRAAAAPAAVPYPAFIDLGDIVVMSLSPELFVSRRGSTVTVRPMKGTARRGRWRAEDRLLAQGLQQDAKARAENVMIVDLLRNDLGRLADVGSVHVRELCRLERYPTVWQLTSTVEAEIAPRTPLRQVLGATFPCGSVTGAPKVSTMGIIADLETAPRGFYTGAICLLEPGGDFTASVPIRTVVLDRATSLATFSVGAGITADSVAADEWAECLAKARVVRPPAVPVDARLFETLRLDDGVCLRGGAHVARMMESAELFGWPAEAARVRAALVRLEHAHPSGTWRARVFLDRHGDVRAEAVPFDATRQVWRVLPAAHAIDVRSPLIFNKTTRREAYDDALAAAPGVDDVLLWNARGEFTESTRANLVLELDGARVTPPIASGLLPGVLRGELLRRGDVREQVVRLGDLRRASRIWLVNSLRGWIDVDFIDG
ncbi:MAG TPA: chorismate-binding protein [Luteitalea sp.]|nr:chorismate-binding protein [Luteitalea sp.]